jgi:hypothetical protein
MSFFKFANATIGMVGGFAKLGLNLYTPFTNPQIVEGVEIPH